MSGTMRRLMGSISKRGSQEEPRQANDDSPEATIARGVRLFCESGGPNNSGEEVLHLPAIVEAAESSPPAAKEAATVIRKFLAKDNLQRAYVQYNSVMLIRILTDHPGKSFTRNVDSKFVAAVKDLLRDGRDMSVQQILRETLDTFEIQKADDETLAPLLVMWKKEKQKMAKLAGAPAPRAFIAPQNPQQRSHAQHRPRTLPPPHELAQRIEEARTSAKLLMQVVESTPPSEVLSNDLIKEFAERCQTASRSVHGYINADSPPPDDDTLQTLIETNDQLAAAMSRHQRAVLQSRRATGAAAPSVRSPPVPSPQPRRVPAQETQDPFDDRHATDAGMSSHYPQMSPNGAFLPELSADGVLPQTHSLRSSAQDSGYMPPRSYSQRQETAAEQVTMHGAAGGNGLVSPVETAPPIQYRF